ncbi:MAG TPA: hypothetical protein VM120_11965 [Bryobacteraceae bacterium]|nr:hypothetical protein [Bryobacteraceae bacterium]
MRIDSPAQGERFEGPYHVDYSRDGESWTSNALDLPETSMTVSTASFPEPGDYFFRVTAINGPDSLSPTVGPVSVAQVRRLELPVRSLSFGEVSLGQVETRSLRIRGAGTGPVRIGRAFFSNALFSLDQNDIREHCGWNPTIPMLQQS